MTEKRFKVTNISSNGMTGLFWLGKDKLSVYDVVKLLNELFEENKKLESELNRQTEITTNLGDFREFITEEQVKLNDDYNNLKKENEQLKQQVTHLTMYKNLFREFQKQLDGVKKKSDLDHKDFEDLIELTKGHVFDDENGWIWLPVNDR